MSMLTKALGIDPLIAAMKTRDRDAIIAALKALYQKYAKVPATETTRAVGVKSDSEQFEEWLDLLFAKPEGK